MSTILQLQTLTLTSNIEELNVVMMSTASGICEFTGLRGEPNPFEME
jgi:hypothetical protein